MHTLWAMSGCAGMFGIFFSRDIGLTLEQIGTLGAIGGTVGLILTYPAGIVADKYHPLRVQLAMQSVILCFTPLGLIYLVVPMSPQAVFYFSLAITLAVAPANILYGASEFPTFMRLYPPERFGQFCSAMSMIRSVGLILGGLVAGLVFDGLKWAYSGSDFAYRWVPAWIWLFQILAVLCLINVYRGWKRFGGMENYQAPLPGDATKVAGPDR